MSTCHIKITRIVSLVSNHKLASKPSHSKPDNYGRRSALNQACILMALPSLSIYFILAFPSTLRGEEDTDNEQKR